jgi:hypothetical protein
MEHNNNEKYYYNNIDFNNLFRMLVTVYTKPVSIFGHIPLKICKECNKQINNMDDIYYNGLELSCNEIHEYLYHDIEFTNRMKDILYDNREAISYLYYKYLRRL